MENINLAINDMKVELYHEKSKKKIFTKGEKMYRPDRFTTEDVFIFQRNHDKWQMVHLSCS